MKITTLKRLAGTRVKAVLLLASSLTVMAGATIAPSLPQMANVFSTMPNAEFLTKLVLTIPALAIALFSPIAGYLIDRFGRLVILYPALLLYAVAGSSGYFMDDLYTILVGRIFLGIAVACIMTIVVTLVGDYFEGIERGKFLGLQAMVMAFGGAVFVSLGGLLADIQWQIPFLIYLFSLLVLVVAFLFLFEPQTTSYKKEHVINPVTNNEWRRIGLLLFVTFASMVMFYMIPVQIPFYLKQIGIEQNSSAGLAIALSTVFSGVVALVYASVKKKLGIDGIFALLFLVMAIGYFLIGLSSDFTCILIAMAVSGIGLGLLMPNVSNWLLEIVSEQNRGKFSGFMSSALFLGQFMSPIIAAPMVRTLGFSTTFIVLSIFLLLFGLFFFGKSITSKLTTQQYE